MRKNWKKLYIEYKMIKTKKKNYCEKLRDTKQTKKKNGKKLFFE